jgi:hypothetical protein
MNACMNTAPVGEGLPITFLHAEAFGDVHVVSQPYPDAVCENDTLCPRSSDSDTV